MKKALLFIAFAAASTFAAADEGHHSPAASKAPSSDAAKSFSDGEVRKIDLEQGKVTIKHGVIENLDMPPMTMVFRLADPSALPKLKVGDMVKFRAERQGGAITVVEITPAR